MKKAIAYSFFFLWSTLGAQGAFLPTKSSKLLSRSNPFPATQLGYQPPEKEVQWYHDFVAKDLPTLEDKVVVITGCTSGIGLVYAKTVAKKGGKVLMLNRPSERANAAQKEVEQAIQGSGSTSATVQTIPCDLMSFDSVRSAAEQIKKVTDTVDVLCCNAGVMALEDKATVDGYDVQMQTNHLSHFLLTKELFPLLTKAAESKGQARVVQQSSGAREKNVPNGLEFKYLAKNGGNMGGNGAFLFTGAKWDRYSQSKLANAVFTSALAARCKAAKSKVIATCAAPGLGATNLQVTTSKTGGMGPLTLFMMRFAQSAEDATMPILMASFLDANSGDNFEPSDSGRLTGPPVLYPLDEKATDPKSCDMLWSASEAACGEFKI